MLLKERLKNYKIVLASQSPRRRELLGEMGLDFTTCSLDVHEVYPEHLQAEEITSYLSELKANAYTFTDANTLLITSDTIVWHNGKALGKPKNQQDAFEMLCSLRGKTHQVISSVCVKTSTAISVISDITKVSFSDITDEELHYYIDTYNPVDKAGAYGIQEWIGRIGISKIEGSYTNVVGLPTEKLYRLLKSI